MIPLEAVIAATAPLPVYEQVDATDLVIEVRRDLRRLRRCLSVQSVMLAVILILNLVVPIAVVVSR